MVRIELKLQDRYRFRSRIDGELTRRIGTRMYNTINNNFDWQLRDTFAQIIYYGVRFK